MLVRESLIQEITHDLCVSMSRSPLLALPTTTAGSYPGSAEKTPWRQGRQGERGSAVPAFFFLPFTWLLGAFGVMAVRFPVRLPAVVLRAGAWLAQEVAASVVLGPSAARGGAEQGAPSRPRGPALTRRGLTSPNRLDFLLRNVVSRSVRHRMAATTAPRLTAVASRVSENARPMPSCESQLTVTLPCGTWLTSASAPVQESSG